MPAAPELVTTSEMSGLETGVKTKNTTKNSSMS